MLAVADVPARLWANEVLHRLADVSAALTAEIEQRGRPRPTGTGSLGAHRSEKAYQRLLEQLPEAIVVHQQGRIVTANQAASTIVGAEGAEALLGQPVLNFVHPDFRALALQRIALTQEEGIEAGWIEEKFLRLDGQPIDVLVLASPVTYAGNPATQVVVVDISERKQVEARLRENESRYRELWVSAQRQAQELALLDQARAALAHELDLPNMIRAVVESIAETFGYALVSLYLLEGEQLLLQHEVGYAGVIRTIPLSMGVTGRTARTGQPILVEDVSGDPDFLEAMPGVVSEVCVPLFDHRRVVGILNVESVEGVRLTQDDLRLMVALSQHISLAIERARLYSEARASERALRRQNEYLAALHDTALALMDRHDVADLLHTIVARAGQLVGTEHGYVYLRETGSDQMMIQVATGAFADYIGFRIAPGEGLSGLSWQTGEPQVVDHYAVWPGHLRGFEKVPFRATMAVPLLSGSMVRGVIGLAHVESERRFGPAEVAMLSRFAQLASLALDNAQLYTSLQQELGERKRAEEALRASEERLLTLASNADVMLFAMDAEGRVLVLRGKGLHKLGLEQDEWVGRSVFTVQAGNEIVLENIRRALAGETFSSIEAMQSVIFETFYSPFYNEMGRFAGTIGVAIDITERKRVEDKLIYDALHDALTGLPNRSFFMDRLEQALERARRRPDGLFAVLFLDLDRFKVINDSMGHLAGDDLLITIARRLEECLRPTDTVARLGGDEFTILLEEMAHAEDAIVVAERVQQALGQPFVLNNQEVFVSASIGIVPGEPGYERPDELLRNADLAMYRAKALGKARHAVFDHAMHVSAVALLKLETALRHAIERAEFRVHYQPIVSLHSRRIAGFEALIRWQHPEQGLIAPGAFMEIAEETGLIWAIGQWSLHEACRQMAEWQRRFPAYSGLPINVNISGKQLLQRDLVQQIAHTLQATGLPAHSLKLELTESAIADNKETVTHTLAQLRALGVFIQLDDFGTGYSSLGYLHQFPIDTLKIDRSFIKKLAVDGEHAIVQTIITLAHSLGMDVVAEGVESEEQVRLLRVLQCEYGQGYHFARPLDPETAETLMALEAGRGE